VCYTRDVKPPYIVDMIQKPLVQQRLETDCHQRPKPKSSLECAISES
jgi:hypothetical protein